MEAQDQVGVRKIFGGSAKVLLTPGPLTITERVEKCATNSGSRNPAFTQALIQVRKELIQIAGGNEENHVCVLWNSSGTGAVQSILASVVSNPDYKLLVVNNGAYGKRILDMAARFKYNVEEFSSSPFEAINLEHVENCLKNSKFTHLAVIHHETTTGLLNDIEKIGQICKKYGTIMLVDAVSSFGVIPINMDQMNIGCLASCGNKNLQGHVGTGFVIAQKTIIEGINYESKDFYFDLKAEYTQNLKNGQPRFTPNVSSIWALVEALAEYKEETPEGRYNRYKQNWEVVQKLLKKVGLKRYVTDENHAKLISIINEPEIEGYNFENMYDALSQKGFEIYPGKLLPNTFRIGNIGAISQKHMEAFATEFEAYLNELKIKK